ncbi:MAG: hypothetical protein R2875_09385 [Desulfobacterales bacterium]
MKISLTGGPASLAGTRLVVENRTMDINRGTPALLATACKVCDYFNAAPPVAYLIGDIGTAQAAGGSMNIWKPSCPGAITRD